MVFTSAALSVLISSILNIGAAIGAGIAFAKLLKLLSGGQQRAERVPRYFSFGLLAFAVPFYAPFPDKLPQTVSAFIALVAVTTLIASRTNMRECH